MNQKDIFSFIDSLSVNSAAERGEDLDSDSLIEDILYNWAGDVVVRINNCHILGFVNNSRPLPNVITGDKENYFNLQSQCGYYLAKVINENSIVVQYLLLVLPFL